MLQKAMFFFYHLCNLGPNDRNFLNRINNENFVRGTTEQNTRLRQDVSFARASEALRVG